MVGGGFGGASAASFARRAYPWLDVTLIEPKARFVTCPYGNLLLAGVKQIGDISFGYDGLRARGVTVVQDWAAGIDPAARTVRLRGGATLSYDRLILSPGIAFREGGMPGYDDAAAERFPHAWIPGDGAQTVLLRRQLEALPDGGVVGLAIPDNPFRCPPGPYERISMIASYLKRAKPRAKILAFDAKNAFSKQGLFQDAWNELYPGMIDWVPANRDGRIVRVDAAAGEFESEFGTRHKVDVGNVIPPQTAGTIALETGLANEQGWVPVDSLTFESRRAPGIHVVGDATVAPPMPKSGYVANSTAKQAVASAAALIRGEAPPPAPIYFNTCYSHVGEGYGISIVGVFRPNAERTGFVETPNSGGVSPRGNHPEQRRLEALHADSWYESITRDMFG
ncbi:MAG: NAD(P)/FAD-dependent oxidoreductase [Acetobacteraceae bacterium]|nr:NAD(P)/FAD-dependent oxidoreductase [Acetobacteraceae bacterium]